MNEESRCVNCKWWTRSPIDGRVGVCDRAEGFGDGEPKHSRSRMFIEEYVEREYINDELMTYPILITYPDHGCREFDKKESA